MNEQKKESGATTMKLWHRSYIMYECTEVQEIHYLIISNGSLRGL